MSIDLTLNVHVTDEDLAVINHVVEFDPEQKPGETCADAWVRRVWRDLGIQAPQALYNKVNRHRQSYLEAKAACEKSGQKYKTAAQRREDEQEASIAHQP